MDDTSDYVFITRLEGIFLPEIKPGRMLAYGYAMHCDSSQWNTCQQHYVCIINHIPDKKWSEQTLEYLVGAFFRLMLAIQAALRFVDKSSVRSPW